MEPTSSVSPRLWQAPLWRCALVTIAVVPLSFFGVLHATTSDQKDLNTVAVAFYFYLCVVLTLPLALVNSFLVAPRIAKVARRKLPAVGSHLILTVVWAGLVFSLYLAILQFPAEPSWLVSWLMLFWNLTMLLGPAVIAGSLAYSLKYNSRRRKLTPCV